MKLWIQITSGRGPAECCWVVAKLVERIFSDAVNQGFAANVLNTVAGEQTKTFKSVLLSIESNKEMDGFVNSWAGTVQWIGRSMFRPKHKRTNWFVGVEILKPEKSDNRNLADIKVERMRSSGPGGQHVNTSESAVRITHIPSGIRVVSSEERSQHLNKKLALARLEKLLKQNAENHAAQSERMRWGRHNNLERGNAIRIFKGDHFREKL